MKKLSNILIIISFIVLIFSGMIVTIVKPKEDKSFYENRMLDAMPVYSRQSVEDGTYFTELEGYLADHAAYRYTLLKFRTYFNEYILRRPVVNNVIVREDILLIYLDYCFFDRDELMAQTDAYVNQLAQLQQLVEGYGGNYYYVGVPCQYAIFEDKYPSYLENRAEYTDELIADFNKAADKYGVNFIDVGQCQELMEGRDIYSSKVDNHYSLQGAYVSYKYIIDSINGSSGSDLTYPTGDKITFVELKNNYLGSSSRKLFGITRITETLFTAEFAENIPFTREDSGVKSYSQVYYPPENPYKDVMYDLYMCGDREETIIKTNRPQLPDVLIYGDSFTNALECLAYYSFDEMRSIDLRHYNKMSLADYIEDYKPDYVICIRDYEALIKTEGNGSPFGESVQP